MTFYFATEKEAADAAEAEIFAAFRTQVATVDPEAIAPDGTIIGRNAGTGELVPDATRTTGFYGDPSPAVQGWFLPQPEDEDLQLVDPTAIGIEVVPALNPWPSLTKGQDPTPLPEWVQPTGAQDAYPIGMWVQHQGLNYESLLASNVWAPSPESNFWRISPDPGPLPWLQPTSAENAYSIGDEVFHEVAGRTETYWRSNIAANTTIPGGDGVFDRWWAPIDKPVGEINEWVQPVPGVESARPYEVDALVTFEGETYRNTVVLNVWPPAGPGAFGWDAEGAAPVAQATVATKPLTKKQQLSSKRARTRRGEYLKDDPATAVNEAWLSGEAPS